MCQACSVLGAGETGVNGERSLPVRSEGQQQKREIGAWEMTSAVESRKQ